MAKLLSVVIFLLSTLSLFGKDINQHISIEILKGDIPSEAQVKDLDWEPLELFEVFDNAFPVYWLKLEYGGPEKVSPSGILLLSMQFDSVAVYANPFDKKAKSITGKLVDYHDKTFPKGYYENALPIAFENSNTVFVKLISIRSASILKRSLSNIEFLPRDEFNQLYADIHLVFVLFTGMEILIIIFFSFIIFLKPSKVNIAYVVMIFISFIEVIIRNQTFDAYWGLSSQFLTKLEFCLIVGMLYSFSAFNAYYLQIKTRAVIWHRIMTFPYILLIIPIYLYNDYAIFSDMINIYFLLTIVGIAVYLIKFGSHNTRRTKLFLVAIGPIIISGFGIILAWKDVLPHDFWIVNNLFIALLFRDIIFMIDLVWRFFSDKALIAIREVEVNQLNKEKDELQKIEALKTVFFNNVSHELRTPLTLLLGPLQSVIDNKSISSHLKQELGMSLRNGKYLLQLVNEILDLSKLDKGELGITKENLDIIPILKGIIESFVTHAKENGQTIYITHSSEGQLLEIDRDKFEKIIINLLSNAIKYSKEDGEIFIKVKAYDTAVSITIEDNGIGIPQKETTKIFDRYYQVNSNTSATGTGIGLSIVKEFMTLHQGEVAVKSVLGEGSTFTLNFPLNGKTEDKPLPVITTGISSIDPTKSTLLIVEDNYDMRKYLDLHMTEFNVLEANNGQEALNILTAMFSREQEKTILPDLMLCDYMMPVMDGATLIHQLKKHHTFSLIPIIFLTARTLQSDKVEILNLGIDDYIVKPFDMKELKLRINISLKNSLKKKDNMKGAAYPMPELTQFKNELDAYILKNIKNPRLHNYDLATQFSMSERSIARKIKAATGQAPASYIREIRLHTAKRKIEYNERSSISEVAIDIGMTNLPHFTQAFKKRFGKLPSDYFIKKD